jgi:hypothetical protein
VQRSTFLNHDRLGLGTRVVVPDGFNVASIARGALIGHDDSIMGLLFGANAAQSDPYHICQTPMRKLCKLRELITRGLLHP